MKEVGSRNDVSLVRPLIISSNTMTPWAVLSPNVLKSSAVNCAKSGNWMTNVIVSAGVANALIDKLFKVRALRRHISVSSARVKACAVVLVIALMCVKRRDEFSIILSFVGFCTSEMVLVRPG